ncbi:MAG TPA: MG2 domain-containing protein [Dissulfurispiraceae bacterium]|nr:MG2 domain-containing protein [Dissulfurispiraceae bacterium]
MRAILSVLLAIILAVPLSAFAQPDAAVEFFSPQGTVKSLRQVSARFSEPIVSFGDLRISDPFDISCPESGKGRWADTKNWVYDFDKDLQAGIKCSFSTRRDLKTLAGRPVTSSTFSFSTGGPAIMKSRPHEGDERIDEEQVFLVTLDAVASEESVLARAYCYVDSVKERIGIKIISGKEREQLLRANHIKDSPRIMALQCRQRFPVSSTVKFIWGKGIASLSGIETESDQILEFKSRMPFTVKFSCDREKKDANCIPILPMRLNFSAPVNWNIARKIRIKGPGGIIYKPLPDSGKYAENYDDEENDDVIPEDAEKNRTPQAVWAVSFKGPFPESSSFTVDMPKDIKDDAGRPLFNADKYPFFVKTDAYPPLAKFSSRFGIIESKGDATLPVTLRNIEAAVPARMLHVDDKNQTATDKIKEEILSGSSTVGDKIVSKLPGAIKNKPGEMVDGLKGRLRKLRMNKEEKVIEWLRTVAGAGRQRSVLKGAEHVQEFQVPKPGGEKAFEVVGIPLREPGVYIVEMESRILGSALLGSDNKTLQKHSVYVPTVALVTNMAVHFKHGRESSLVWVTTLDQAKPVADAYVTVRDCSGKPVWNGTTDGDGIARIAKRLPDQGELPSCRYKPDADNYYDYPQLRGLEGTRGGLFVFAKKAGDMSFVHSNWKEGIESWRYGLPSGSYRGPVIAHTVFDRTLVRAGETVHMKHFIRKHTMTGIEFMPERELPDRIIIEHSGSDKKYEFPLKWRDKGVAVNEWKIPEDAYLGQYEVTLTNSRKNNTNNPHSRYISEARYESGNFRVEEFRIPLMRGFIQAPKEPQVNVSELDVDIMVSYLSGGGAGNAAVKLRSVIQPKYVSFDSFDDFVFSNGPVKEGIDRHSRQSYSSDEEIGASKKPKIITSDLSLDPSGALRTKITPLPRAGFPQEVASELEFRDPNGEVQTVSSRIPLWNSRTIVGIKPDSWAATADNFKFHLLALDLTGKPIPGVPVKADLYQRKNYSHRKRLIGGFYAYEHVTETKKLGAFCKGITDTKGLVICEVKSPVSGNVIIQATAKDSEGNISTANRDVWVYGKGEWWFDVSDNDRIDLIPERKRYEPGEKAKFQVRMPFRSATVLVTVEREGIIDAFIKKLSGKNSSIEVPIKGSYAPNVFVSALCVRGRVESVKPTALIDLGKPAFKLGMSEVKVGWKAHELKVEVYAQKDVYQVREKAQARIKVRTAEGVAPPKGSEVAIAAVDEGLLELMPNRSWQLLDAMMSQRGHEVETSTAQMQVVGKRHYGLKALPHGGGGGRQTTRELFDTLLLWKGSVNLDANGEASVEIPINDSLTLFRIVAIADGMRNRSGSLFGTGYTSIRTTQDLMILAGLPPVVREEDSFHANFTIRNASKRPIDAIVSGTSSALKHLSPIEVSLQAGEAKEIGWDISVPKGIDSISWEITAGEKKGNTSDRLRVKQKVVPATRVSTYQATISQVTGQYALQVDQPKDSSPNRGGIRITLSPKLSSEVSGINDYMRSYPYSCLEQKTSIAVALKNQEMWNKIVGSMPSHMDSDGLLKYFPAMQEGSDTLTAYVLSISSEAGWQLPENIREKMIEGLTGFISGKVVRRSALTTADLSIRKIAALEAISHAIEVRPELLGSISVELNLWPTSAVIDWMNLLIKSKAIPERSVKLREAEQVLRSRFNFQGTTMGFSTEQSDYLWWLMVSADVNAVRSVLTLLNLENWNDDMPRIVRGALERQHKGRWNTTVANAWGVLALEKFSRKFEMVPVAGSTAAILDKKELSFDWTASPKGGSIMFNWPKESASLGITHHGSGRPWVTVQSLAAIRLKEPLSSGFKIKKTVTPVVQKSASGWRRGDVARIRLDLEAQTDVTWVVVNDPVPAGSSILGTGLGRDSQMIASDEKKTGRVWPAFEERSFEAFRAYYEYVPKGHWAIEYTIRLNNDGSFVLPETRVEALYVPEMFGAMPNRKMAIGR